VKTEAMVIRKNGGPEVLQREEIDLPEPGPRQIRVRVRAVALNHIDLWARAGLPNVKYEFPHRLGADVVGEIDAIGDGAVAASGKLTIGQKIVVSPGISCGVCARCLSGADNFCSQYKMLGENTQGGYARHINIPDANVLPYPGGQDSDLKFTDVAAIPLCFLTAACRARRSKSQSSTVHASSQRPAPTKNANAPKRWASITPSTTRRTISLQNASN
jgi:NADPH:quinone reductase-like Zn-dependent oxidoreductase